MILSCSGCGQSVKPSSDQATTDSIQHESSGDSPIKLTATISKAKLRLSDELTLTLAVKKSDDYRVEFLPLESLLTDFTVIDSKAVLPKLEGEFELQLRVYQLQPNKAGKLELIIPPVSYFAASQSDNRLSDANPSDRVPSDSSNSNDPQLDGRTSQALGFAEVDPFEIEVVSELTETNPSLDSLRAQAQPLELEKSPASYAVWIAVVAALIALIPALIAFAAARRAKKNAPVVSPRDQALKELDLLVLSKLAAEDVKRYYVELTAIVRRYIEGTTGVRAPEQTTEEFLREVVQGRSFSAAIVSRLQAFLESADMVKFAGRKPIADEVTNSQTMAREFILTDLIESNADRAGVDPTNQRDQIRIDGGGSSNNGASP